MKPEVLAVATVLAAGTPLAALNNAAAETQNGFGAGRLAETDVHGMLRRGAQIFCLPALCGSRNCKRHVESKGGVRGSQGSAFCKRCPQRDCGDEEEGSGEELEEGPGRGLLPFSSGSQPPSLPPDPDDAPQRPSSDPDLAPAPSLGSDTAAGLGPSSSDSTAEWPPSSKTVPRRLGA